jgi:hypothetical protein
MEQNGQGGSNPGQQKQGGLSWSQPSPAALGATSPLMPNSTAPNAQKPGAAPMSAGKPGQNQNAAQKGQQGTSTNHKSKNDGSAPSNRTGMVAGAIVVVVLLLGAWIVWGGGNGGGSTVAGTASSTQTGADQDMDSDNGIDTSGIPPASGSVSGSLSVASPQDAGLTVAVTSATVSVPTWVVVYESSNGQPGRALGATLFFPAQNGKMGTVSLLRATQPGQSYFVGLSADTGNDRVFSLHGDKQITGGDGKPVWYTFTTR